MFLRNCWLQHQNCTFSFSSRYKTNVFRIRQPKQLNKTYKAQNTNSTAQHLLIVRNNNNTLSFIQLYIHMYVCTFICTKHPNTHVNSHTSTLHSPILSATFSSSNNVCLSACKYVVNILCVLFFIFFFFCIYHTHIRHEQLSANNLPYR